MARLGNRPDIYQHRVKKIKGERELVIESGRGAGQTQGAAGGAAVDRKPLSTGLGNGDVLGNTLGDFTIRTGSLIFSSGVRARPRMGVHALGCMPLPLCSVGELYVLHRGREART